MISTYRITDLESGKIDLIESRQIPIILLYKGMEPGNYNTKLDPRAGKLAISRTTVRNYMFTEPQREMIPFSECKTDTFAQFELANVADV